MARLSLTRLAVPIWQRDDEHSGLRDVRRGDGPLETLDAVPYYVLKTGSAMEAYSCKRDLAYYMEESQGQVLKSMVNAL